MRELGGMGALLHTLSDSHPKVLQRAAGALHNLSSDAGAIRAIRTLGGIPSLVKLLGNEAPGVAGAAAGAIQNVSREVASRLIIRWVRCAVGTSECDQGQGSGIVQVSACTVWHKHWVAVRAEWGC